jgi:hypothetical protein
MRTTKSGGDVPLLIIDPLLCEQIQIGVSLLTATVPNMKAFIQSFHSQLGMPIGQLSESRQTTQRETSVVRQTVTAPSTGNSSPPATSKSSNAPPTSNPAPSSKLAEDSIESTTFPTSSAPV